MRFLRSLPFVSLAARSCVAEPTSEPQYILSNPPASESNYRIPTSYESAVLGRRILALTPLGTLATVFPDSSRGRQPDGLGGVPLGLMEYVADCEEEGNPTILAIKIGTTFRNVDSGSNISLAQEWTPPYPPDKRIKSTFFDWLFGRDADTKDRVPYSAVNLPRYSLLGYIEKIDSADAKALSSCFVDTHPDSKYWLPGNEIHESEFVRLVVTQIYWIGGFGDRAYIGWIPVDEWKNVTRKEWESVRLPGEKKGWDEWSTSDL
ncbi:pyridoxamine 5'-phosphate oxidase-domain-containing protein [Daldinia loculata]|uniref:pyridoxamine 5'-phosphate oxidase-domain-containing protein n=1 Tax=Daldinia loculata TaxID=103429 RepID=UPI0020C59DD7|nr:pyridoxamine 5'-phosphate oxidase-domain-containing protein [Daldinia loculata]KAI1648745.1 pyridoxamine 5'-phosphate oxidase-domain-containing protein [Daldinia loculata]